ncbi:histidine phosphatase superfamily protein (branch 1) [Chryseobacterium sp. 52]|uniref:phosphoglycerate mutase family protein n=1 Tax=Chryseobacterium sp. 52 TaxID=2035213 RepID=UPI000C19DBFE|nr:phosphoglycerate mutase family protein [Chryseobacterium sp. 52]PIF46986.1 histidine phosphatase superfamily protein (branch 1) [Chryseobacterium sp. 52]
MKNLLSTLLLIISFTFMHSQTTNIYIVRHAEKDISDINNKNPNLSEAGKQRAKKLLKDLQKVKFSAAYSTPFNRTQQTLQPLAEFNKIEITSYNPSDNKKLVEEIRSTYSGKNVIIAGHSNTILNILEAFGAPKPFETISEDDYSNLFHIIIKKHKVKLSSSKY